MTLQDEIKPVARGASMNAADVRTLLRQDHDDLLQFGGTCTNRKGEERRARSGN